MRPTQEAQSEQNHRLTPQTVGQWPVEQLPQRKTSQKGTDRQLYRFGTDTQLIGNRRNSRQIHIDGQGRQPEMTPSKISKNERNDP